MVQRLTTVLLAMLPGLVFGQQYAFYHFPDEKEIDSLQKVIPTITSDTMRMTIFRRFGFYYAESRRDSSFYFLNKQLQIARKFGLKLWEVDALDNSAFSLWRLGNFPEALQRFLEGIKIAEDPSIEKSTWGIEKFDLDKNPRTGRLIVLAQLHFDLATLYEQAGYAEKELTELLEGEQVALQNRDKSALSQIYEGLGGFYLARRSADTALAYLQKSAAFSEQSGFRLMEGDCFNDIGNAYLIKDDYVAAKRNYLRSIEVNTGQNSYAGLTHNYLSLAGLYRQQNNYDSGLFYARQALRLTAITRDLSDESTVYSALATAFKLKKNIDSAFEYQGMALRAKDSLNNVDKVKQFENVGFTEQLRVQQLQEERQTLQNRIRTYAMLAGLGVVLIIALILYRNNLQKQKANATLANTLSNLKSTQAQLIQSEKMASLGELTSGIAHEIQNPLNFVNNFAEVNRELLDELKTAAIEGNTAEIETIVNDIKVNEEKIIHHGRRADVIVKGMLQHSRSSTGVKEDTDINILADECLRLSYLGFRAKGNSCDVTIKTNFDRSFGKIDIIPQDIAKVLMNLYNNAFYAVNEKRKSAAEDGYVPIVVVSTYKSANQFCTSVKDNGEGITQNLVDKIFQPFFTTKPTGQGTGLGLSLSYDIVKAHGGSINVETKEGFYTEFIMTLPP